MCTVTIEKPVLQVADEDIVVYKYVDIIYKSKFFGLFRYIDYYRSAIRGYTYLPSKIHETNLEEFEFHERSYYRGLDVYLSQGGFHSYDNALYGNVRCIIPKGAKYYKCVNIRDNIVIYHSDKIKIIGQR